jgi:hypothetical protein
MDDAHAELNDVSAALNPPDAPASESAEVLERPLLTASVLQAKLDKKKTNQGEGVNEEKIG